MSALPSPPAPQPVHALDLGRLASLVARAFPGAGPMAHEAMPGGASTRQYFRVTARRLRTLEESGVEAWETSHAVGMFVPDGAKPEEAGKHDAGARWPFLEVRDLLASRGVDVPAVLAQDTSSGWVLLEDLGDDTLARFLTANPGLRQPLYTTAVTDLAAAQRALSDLPAGSVVASRAFDEDLLLWEIHHFREWALEARGLALSAEDARTWGELASRIAKRIAAWPRSFVHRDYQSRNLMVRSGDRLRTPEGSGVEHPERLCWIDFQDALLGPRVYDLVALLNDSYQTFDRPFVEARLGDYARARGLDASGRQALGFEFDLVTVQRKLKDAGRFVFIDRVKKNPSFLPFVEPTIAKVRASLARLAGDEDARALSDLLARVLA